MLLLSSWLLLSAHQGQKSSGWIEQTFARDVAVSAPIKLKSIAIPKTDSKPVSGEVWAAFANGYTFSISIVQADDIAMRQPSLALTNFLAGFIHSVGDDIDGERDIVFNGWQGVALTVRGSVGNMDGRTVVARVYFLGNRFLSLSGSYDSSGARPAAIDRFLDSLRVTSPGTTKEAGPPLSRFPLGNSGISALFPAPPKHHETEIGEGKGKGTLYTYATEYAFRNFLVSYKDLASEPPDNATDEQMFSLWSTSTDQILDELHAKKGKQRDIVFGKDRGLSTDLTIEPDVKGKFVLFIHGARMIVILELAPKGYQDSKAVDLFLHSVEIK